MEVNPRLWQWHGLARACGVDLPRIAYLDVLGRPQRPVRSGPEHDGPPLVVAAAHLRASRQEGDIADAARCARSARTPSRARSTCATRCRRSCRRAVLVTAPIARRLRRRRGDGR